MMTEYSDQLLACHNTIREFAMNEPINALFAACVLILEVIGEWTGMGYNLANLVIFVALQPALIVLFAWLWRRERRNKELILNRIPAVWRRIVRKDIGV